MPDGHPRSSRPALIAAVTVPMVLVATHIASMRVALIDDAFITFRYAANAAAGHGLVFNLGEKVEGFSNLLWTLLMTVLARVGLDLPHTALLLNKAFLLLGVLVMFRWTLLMTGSRLAAGAVAAVMALTTNIVGASVMGLETPLYMLALELVLLATVEEGRGGSLLFGIALVLVGAVRAEGMVLAPVLAVAVCAIRALFGLPFRRFAIAAAPAFAVLVAAKLWEHAYFGHWLPMSVLAKRDGDVSTFVSFFRAYSAGADYLARALGWPMLVVLLVSTVLLRAIPRRSATLASVLVALGATAFGLAVCVSNKGDWMPYARLVAPYLPLVEGALGAGAWFTIARSVKDDTRRGLALVGWAAVLGMAAALPWTHSQWPDESILCMGPPELDEVGEIGRIIHDVEQPGQVSIVAQLGRIGYYAGTSYVGDADGVIDPAIALSHRASSVFGKQDWAYLISQRPILFQGSYWPYLRGFMLNASDDYSVVLSRELAAEHVFILVRTDVVPLMAHEIKTLLHADIVDRETGAKAWAKIDPDYDR